MACALKRSVIFSPLFLSTFPYTPFLMMKRYRRRTSARTNIKSGLFLITRQAGCDHVPGEVPRKSCRYFHVLLASWARSIMGKMFEFFQGEKKVFFSLLFLLPLLPPSASSEAAPNRELLGTKFPFPGVTKRSAQRGLPPLYSPCLAQGLKSFFFSEPSSGGRAPTPPHIQTYSQM